MFFNNGLDRPRLFLSPDDPKGGDPPGINKLIERTEYLDKELKTVISQRDAEKKEKADALGRLKEIEDAKLKESGEFQKLADDYKAKYENALPELETYKKDSDELKLYKENRKKVLIEAIPEEQRENWKEADIMTLEKVVVLFGDGHKPTMDAGKSGKTNIKTEGKVYEDFTIDQLDEIKKTNPQEWDRLFRSKRQTVHL